MATFCSKLWRRCSAVVCSPAAIGMTIETRSGVAGGQAETHLPADRPPHHGVETVDPEVVEQPHLAVDDVVEGHRRKARPVGRPVVGSRLAGPVDP